MTYKSLDAPSLEKLMIRGDDKDTWISTCKKVGQFLATTRDNFNKIDITAVLQSKSIK